MRSTLLRTFALAVALSVALLAPGVAAAVGGVGGTPAPGAEDLLPSGVQTSHVQPSVAASTARRTEVRFRAEVAAATPRVASPLSLERSSLSAQRGPPPLRGPPAFTLR